MGNNMTQDIIVLLYSKSNASISGPFLKPKVVYEFKMINHYNGRRGKKNVLKPWMCPKTT